MTYCSIMTIKTLSYPMLNMLGWNSIRQLRGTLRIIFLDFKVYFKLSSTVLWPWLWNSHPFWKIVLFIKSIFAPCVHDEWKHMPTPLPATCVCSFASVIFFYLYNLTFRSDCLSFLAHFKSLWPLLPSQAPHPPGSAEYSLSPRKMPDCVLVYKVTFVLCSHCVLHNSDPMAFFWTYHFLFFFSCGPDHVLPCTGWGFSSLA